MKYCMKIENSPTFGELGKKSDLKDPPKTFTS